MNPIGEFDQELLEDYLDDALSPGQVEHVALRLAGEPELALAMHEMRAGRVLRSAAWRSFEPTQHQAGELADRLVQIVRRDVRRRRTRLGVWASGAAAAAVAIFVTGWQTRSGVPAPSRQVSVGVTAPAPRIKPIIAIAPDPGPYHVALLDRDGRLTPAQRFTKADDARQFARDLAQYENRKRDAEQGGAMLVSDHF